MSQLILETIKQLTQNVVSPYNLGLVSVKIVTEGKQQVLEITIHRSGGNVSLDDCQVVSRKLEEALDNCQLPLINDSYVLAVQSPGMERILKTEEELEIFKGEQVMVRTKESLLSLGNRFTGKLQEKQNGQLAIAFPQPVFDSSQKASSKKSKSAVSKQTLSMVNVDCSKIIDVRLYPQGLTQKTK